MHAQKQQQLTLHDAVVKLDNLKLESMEALWRSFTETAASFAVSKSELIKILAVLTDTVVTWGDRTEASTEMTRLSTELFEHWVSLSPRKSVEYVDGLEVIAALLCISRLDIQDKVCVTAYSTSLLMCASHIHSNSTVRCC
jgi:hypothetical protein